MRKINKLLEQNKITDFADFFKYNMFRVCSGFQFAIKFSFQFDH